MKKQKWYHVLTVKVPTKWYHNGVLYHDNELRSLENERLLLLFFLKRRLVHLCQRRKRIDPEKIKFKFTDLGKSSFQIDWWEPIFGGGK